MTATADAVEAYIAALPDRVRELFLAVRAAARSAAPDAEERISYGMPALFQGGVLAYYGAFKHHVGLYPPPATEALRVESASYAGPKGNLKFRVGAPAPELLVSEIVRERLRQNQCKATGRNPKTSPPRVQTEIGLRILPPAPDTTPSGRTSLRRPIARCGPDRPR